MSASEPVVIPQLPSLRLDGKRALVTGAGRGIGVACAAALTQAGAHVTLLSRTGDEIEAVAAALRAEGGAADCLVADVTESASLGPLLDARAPYDILVNNAGTNRPMHFLEVTLEDFDAVAALNLRATFFVSQLVARRLAAEKRPGSIIHMSSQMGHVGGTHRTVYCATKHAVEGLTKAMAIDLGPLGIRVNTIGPTFIETPLTRPFFAQEGFRTNVLSKIKLGRVGQVEDLMGAVVYLASDASSLMTGTAMIIDGGWTAD
ncbi:MULTISPECIES: SDR family NAD(P)-dependent oxidoreductase [unclassified Acidisoma]|jgi:NAD(P)-dependent dehydrogenase (short-subunit alcohol dehydrogenase family)|uniref:SDR family NAD(P)-dependent oxidoreductase n=1 Tax=unclassified Acidisoma TaxID=2634065 RepID=UPI00131B98E5|nr:MULTISPECIES: SDR family oxidoreductase [unclassified Acidisoma]